jgi:hypothetical protein
MLKKLLTSIFSLVLFFTFTNTSFAQETDTAPIELSPELAEINGDTASVEITFHGLEDLNWHICSKEKCLKAKDTLSNKKASVENGSLTLTVCAANDSTLRVNDCDDGDYFHEGKVYILSLFEDEEQEIKGPTAAFYVNHFFPNVRVSTADQLIHVEITGTKRPKDKGNRNNYQISIEGFDVYENKYKQDKCVTVKEEGTKATFGKNGPNDSTPLNRGKYTVKINEQVNEGVKGKLKTGGDVCNGGFTFWHVNTEVDGVFRDIVCDSAGDSGAGCTKDPNSSDIDALNELLEELSAIGKLILNCDKYSRNEDGNLQCVSINTAIGTIPTNPIAFIERLFSIVLSLAGVGALGLLIYGGYNYMVSRGDPERIKGARETITSAIIGLLFIIFSLVILQVIAGDILRIPGFGGPSGSNKTGIDRVDNGTIPGTELPPNP